MDRLARNLDDLRSLVQTLTRKGVRVEFVKEQLVFTGEDSPMANLLLSVMGAFAEFERSLIRERQREGIALAKQRGAYKGRNKTLTPERAAAELVQRAATGVPKSVLASDYGLSREGLPVHSPGQTFQKPSPAPGRQPYVEKAEVDGSPVIGVQSTGVEVAARPPVQGRILRLRGTHTRCRRFEGWYSRCSILMCSSASLIMAWVPGDRLPGPG